MQFTLIHIQKRRVLTAILVSKLSDGTIGMAPPFLPNLRSNEFCTLSG